MGQVAHSAPAPAEPVEPAVPAVPVLEEELLEDDPAELLAVELAVPLVPELADELLDDPDELLSVEPDPLLALEPALAGELLDDPAELLAVVLDPPLVLIDAAADDEPEVPLPVEVELPLAAVLDALEESGPLETPLEADELPELIEVPLEAAPEVMPMLELDPTLISPVEPELDDADDAATPEPAPLPVELAPPDSEAPAELESAEAAGSSHRCDAALHTAGDVHATVGFGPSQVS